jgi:hypothetical protein
MERNIESNSAPAQELRTENMRFTCLVLVEERKQGWYYEAFPPSEIRKRFPNVRTENLTTDAGNPEFIRREQALSAAIDAFQEASGRFEADLQRMRSDPAGEKYYQALMKAYANVGVLLRHVTWEELQKEPPGAGVLYKKQ